MPHMYKERQTGIIISHQPLTITFLVASGLQGITSVNGG